MKYLHKDDNLRPIVEVAIYGCYFVVIHAHFSKTGEKGDANKEPKEETREKMQTKLPVMNKHTAKCFILFDVYLNTFFHVLLYI